MKLFQTLALTILTLALFQQCSKDRFADQEIKEVVENDTTSTDTLIIDQIIFSSGETAALFDKLKKEPTLSEISNSGNLPFIGPEGTKAWIYSENLLDENNNPVSYPYQIEILELYSPKDMILYNVPTVSNGEALVSGGEFRIRAFKDGKRLKANPNINIEITVPTAEPDFNMGLFFGTETNNSVNWQQAEQITLTNPNDSTQGNRIDTSNFVTINKDSYGVNTNQLNWINCDYFYSNNGPKTPITFISNDTTKPIESIIKYIYLPELNSIMNAYGTTSGEIVIGLEAIVVALAADTKGDAYFFLSEKFIIADNQQVDIIVEKATDESIKTALDGLGF